MDYTKLSVKELKSLAEQHNFKGVSKLKKDELIDLFNNLEETQVSEVVPENKLDIPLPPPLPESDTNQVYDGVEIPDDPKLLVEQFRPTINVNLPTEKKIQIINTIAKYKAEEKSREKQEIKNQMDDLIIYAKTIKDEFRAFKKEITDELEATKLALKDSKTEFNSLKSELKDLRDSFIMKMIMKKVGNVPFEQMPIFKNKVVPHQLQNNH